jgi:hypothetical protein
MGEQRSRIDQRRAGSFDSHLSERDSDTIETMRAWARGLVVVLLVGASCSNPSDTGTVVGELRAQGGPSPRIDILTSGNVTVWSGETVVASLTVDGTFELELQEGNYRLTGHLRQRPSM